MKKVLNSFINEYKESFDEFFNVHIQQNISKREDYIEILNKIQGIYNQHPKFRNFIQDNSPTAFNEEETKILNELYDLHEQLHVIELLEAFKLGGKEAFIFFKEQDLLKI